MRWRVERCGYEGSYLPGWIAYDLYDVEGTGAWHPTWEEAQRMAYDMARGKLRDIRGNLPNMLARWGMAM